MTSSASSSRSVSLEPPKVEKKKLKRKHREAVKDADDVPIVEEAPVAAAEGDDDAEETPAEPEVPVLSHAERRRQKKEAKLAAKANEEAAEAEAEGAAVKKRKLKDGSAKKVDASSTKHRQNSVWAGNMSFKTQQEDVRRFFKDVGEITRINMPTKAPAGPGMRPENRGFAYIDFATPEAKAKAIALSEQPLLGRKLLIKDGDSFEGRPAATAAGELTLTDPALVHKTHSKTAQKILRAQKQPPASTLFLGNLGYETTEASIRQLLDAHRPGNKKGKDVARDLPAEKDDKKDDEEDKDVSEEMDTAVEDESTSQKPKPKDDWIRQIRMGTFEDSGLCKGFAFVDFTSVEHATSALINPKNHHLDGRNLLVEYASPDAVRRGLNPFRPPGERSAANHGKKRPHRTERLQARAAMRPAATSDETSTPNGDDGEEDASSRPKRSWEHKEQVSAEGGVRHKGPKSRPKPGAALALAKRESVAIVPSQGQKITF
ncbi:hypothetical protein BDN70DRAFT_868641 [Pholiota conissans]|uniref:RRM domain-containing protein n=1 Tax=Pholiota conissans TaxID=109636 RepID=A0A9P6CTK0_9AGAR|nr:hypothetical protein BDN70DRAFT_868641 [Pholiota conissans]